jgi:hypothetical protein
VHRHRQMIQRRVALALKPPGARLNRSFASVH